MDKYSINCIRNTHPNQGSQTMNKRTSGFEHSTASIAEKKVTWLELFYDLLFVAAVSKASHVLLHVEAGTIPLEYLSKFILIFVPIWWAWVGQSLL